MYVHTLYIYIHIIHTCISSSCSVLTNPAPESRLWYVETIRGSASGGNSITLPLFSGFAPRHPSTPPFHKRCCSDRPENSMNLYEWGLKLQTIYIPYMYILYMPSILWVENNPKLSCGNVLHFRCFHGGTAEVPCPPCRSAGVSDVDRDHFGAETGIKAQWFLAQHPSATGGHAGHWSVLSRK